MYLNRREIARGSGVVFWLLGWFSALFCLLTPRDHIVWPAMALLSLLLMVRGVVAVRWGSRRRARAGQDAEGGAPAERRRPMPDI